MSTDLTVIAANCGVDKDDKHVQFSKEANQKKKVEGFGLETANIANDCCTHPGIRLKVRGEFMSRFATHVICLLSFEKFWDILTPARLEVAADSKLPSEVKTARTKDHWDLIRGISDYGTVWVGVLLSIGIGHSRSLVGHFEGTALVLQYLWVCWLIVHAVEMLSNIGVGDSFIHLFQHAKETPKTNNIDIY